MTRTQATFKLGIEFCDWGPPWRFVHPFVRRLWQARGRCRTFHHHCCGSMRWATRRPLALIRCDHGRPPRPFWQSRSALSDIFPYAFQFDAALYARLSAQLRRSAWRAPHRRQSGGCCSARGGWVRRIPPSRQWRARRRRSVHQIARASAAFSAPKRFRMVSTIGAAGYRATAPVVVPCETPGTVAEP